MEKNDDPNILKKQIRKAVLSARNTLSEEQLYRAKVLITEKLCGHQWFYCSDILLCFLSYGSEIDTKDIVNEALRLGKKVFVPKVEGEEMVFYRITSLYGLQEGYKGIPEPSGDCEKYEYPGDENEELQHTLLLMPGVAFDPYRNRIGYGKGFYDRFLRDKQGLWTRSIAIGHFCQQVDIIPAEEFDIRPYQVILV